MINRIKAIALQKPTHKRVAIIAVGLSLMAVSIVTPLVYADRYDQQISELRKKNNGASAAREDLAVAAQDLKSTINSLKSEISAIEGQLSENKSKQRDLQNKIIVFQKQLDKEREVLGVNIKQMYVEDETSTLIMLASSQNLSEYLDRDQYRTNVQAKITETMARIEELKKQLDAEKSKVDKLIKDQEGMRKTLSVKKTETNRLLNLNESQQAAFNATISTNNKKITELQRKQAIENARYNVGSVSYSGSGSYPWANAPFPNSISDPWGMYKRQCVSYTAWKVASTGRHMPYWGGRGNAKLWDDNARAAGIPVDGTPRVGSVAVSNYGTYGHVMYVEKVHGDGTITISQYNANWDGRYSVARRTTTGLVFVHFQ
jgi:peptidoglycan DL-endopeptidase CwlO